MNIMKFIAGTCANEADAACMRIFHVDTERREQYLKCIVLAAIMTLAATAIILTIYLLHKNRKNH